MPKRGIEERIKECKERDGNAENLEMTQKNIGNDQFKGRREVKIIENEDICKNLVSDI